MLSVWIFIGVFFGLMAINVARTLYTGCVKGAPVEQIIRTEPIEAEEIPKLAHPVLERLDRSIATIPGITHLGYTHREPMGTTAIMSVWIPSQRDAVVYACVVLSTGPRPRILASFLDVGSELEDGRSTLTNTWESLRSNDDAFSSMRVYPAWMPAPSLLTIHRARVRAMGSPARVFEADLVEIIVRSEELARAQFESNAARGMRADASGRVRVDPMKMAAVIASRLPIASHIARARAWRARRRELDALGLSRLWQRGR
jgi:hypothetical protein